MRSAAHVLTCLPTAHTRRGARKGDEMDYLAAVTEFLEDQVYKGNSPLTVLYYRERLERFARESETVSLDAFSEVTIRRWLVSKRHFARNTLANYDRALRVFAHWLYHQGYTAENRMAKLSKPRPEATQITPFSSADISRLLVAARTGKNPLRDAAIIITLLDTGIRIGELANLELHHVQWIESSLKVKGKSGERTVPFGRKTKAAVKNYVDKERTAASPSVRHVFLNASGDELRVERAKQQFTRLARRADIKTSKVGPHQMRHTFAVEFIRAGGDAFSLQQILGHSTLEMTRRYVHLAQTDLREAHRRFSPGNRLL